MSVQPRVLFIVGQNSLLNQAIQYTIRELLASLSTSAFVVESFDDAVMRRDPNAVVLVDDGDENAKAALFRRLEEDEAENAEGLTAALFNIEPEDETACTLVTKGVRGLFFSTDPITRLLEGVEQLLSENVWIPKEILLRAAQRRRHDPEDAVQATRLTMREMQILAHVCTGATNDQIGSVLCISSHTVKTHMYNLFPKIGVKNRLHAALWAAANIRTQIDYLSTRPQTAATR